MQQMKTEEGLYLCFTEYSKTAYILEVCGPGVECGFEHLREVRQILSSEDLVN